MFIFMLKSEILNFITFKPSLASRATVAFGRIKLKNDQGRFVQKYHDITTATNKLFL